MSKRIWIFAVLIFAIVGFWGCEEFNKEIAIGSSRIGGKGK